MDKVQEYLNRQKEATQKTFSEGLIAKEAELDQLKTEFGHLLDVKTDKLNEEVLSNHHTQLSYLSEVEQKWHKAMAQVEIYKTILIPALKKI